VILPVARSARQDVVVDHDVATETKGGEARREVMKRDRFGRVEREVDPNGREATVRFASGADPVSDLLGRLLLARERRALAALDGLDGVPRLLPLAAGEDSARVLRRSFVPGVPLWAASHLPRDWFEHLEALVRAVHARGVCHNDLHKEQNLLVRPDGKPALIDMQLASLHAGTGRVFRVRAAEDLRHVDKHRRRYLRRGAPKTDADRAGRAPRSFLAAIWRRFGKPLYGLAKRALGGPTSIDPSEPRRASSGPWPEWTAPLAGAAPPIAPPRKFDTST
jgi:predicted Ser/Thr protein kinase